MTLEEAMARAAAEAGAPGVEITSEVPPTPDRGDAAFPTAFALAKTLRRPPREIAEELAARVRSHPEAARVEVAGPGYVNVFLRREAHLRSAAEAKREPDPEGSPAHIVEHTSINPNKAAHIGHLRNAALGDCYARVLRHLGRRVEVHNYIDDTGVQVADVVLGFVVLRRSDADEVRRLAGGERFDFLCWDLYAEVSRWLEEVPERAETRKEALHGLEHGEAPWAEMGRIVSEAIALRHVRTMERIGARYDLLPREGTVLALRFWERAFRRLRERGAIRFTEEGRHAGCWVMDTALAQDGEKVIVRGNGTVTYVGKDIAYQMWQLGRLGAEFRYRRFHEYPDGAAVWITTDRDGDPDAPGFGAGAVADHVVDSRQAYPQGIVQEAIARLSPEAESGRSRHLAYEMVAITPRTFGQLGFGDSGDRAVEMSGRKGIGVKADDFLDALEARAREEVAARNPDIDPGEQAALATDIAVGALRYFMVRTTRNQLIAFDLDEALSFDGNTGPYLQYAAVRARNILAKAGIPIPDGAPPPPPAGLDDRLAALDSEEADALWLLAREAAALDGITRRVEVEQEPQILARFAYSGAQRFNAFYHRYRIVGESDEGVRELRAWAVAFFFARHRTALELLGVPVPDRM